MFDRSRLRRRELYWYFKLVPELTNDRSPQPDFLVEEYNNIFVIVGFDASYFVAFRPTEGVFAVLFQSAAYAVRATNNSKSETGGQLRQENIRYSDDKKENTQYEGKMGRTNKPKEPNQLATQKRLVWMAPRKI